METDAQRIARETEERVERKLREAATRLEARYAEPPLDLQVRLKYLRNVALGSRDE